MAEQPYLSNMRKVILLGASGNIGEQALDILLDRSRYELVGISVGQRVGKIERILHNFHSISSICVKNEGDVSALKKHYPDKKIYHGDAGLISLLEETPCDMVINALVGFSGLRPSIKALELNRILALANKESLVVGGHLVNALLDEGKGKLYPIDSEHVAFAKCLSKVNREEVDSFLITASGGAFRNKSRAELIDVTPEEALAHPTWNMGKKITIDCATMFNKGFEIIEAKVLFDCPLDKISPIIHRESYVHSLLRMKDGSYVADVGKPDMHGPIEYALKEADLPFEVMHVDKLEDLGDFHFAPFAKDRYPAVSICLKAYRMGGTALAVLNAADEEAVALFLNKKIPFVDIEKIVDEALNYFPIKEGTLENLILFDNMARDFVRTRYGV